ncbi:MAG: AbrB/MazE/SpoVT family DNA-binding domain-containing protein [Candidatus Marinimicrobia bacterium]|nr:AbrB/MazE/SpoVT family DNA-binding domain-containing protein [Candidatus Neomarinimicrobiota bacterium]
MKTISTTKMSSKGQVVIPEKIRKQLGLKSGVQFVVLGKDDVVILKAIESPSISEFDKLILQAREQAVQYGFKQTDIEEAIKDVKSNH